MRRAPVAAAKAERSDAGGTSDVTRLPPLFYIHVRQLVEWCSVKRVHWRLCCARCARFCCRRRRLFAACSRRAVRAWLLPYFGPAACYITYGVCRQPAASAPRLALFHCFWLTHARCQVLDTNTNLTRIEVGPQVFTPQQHEKLMAPPAAFIVIPSRCFAVIGNPVLRAEVDGEPIVRDGALALRHGEQVRRICLQMCVCVTCC